MNESTPPGRDALVPPEARRFLRAARAALRRGEPAPEPAPDLLERLSPTDRLRLGQSLRLYRTLYAPRPGRRAGGARPAPEPVPLPVVPGFTLLRVAGRGAFGTVYEAEDDTTFGRRVALKLLHEHCTEGDLRRFRRESEILAQLNHPNVVALLSVGSAAGRPFLVMPFIDGTDLAHHAWDDGAKQFRPQDVRWSARLIATVVQAVHAVHGDESDRDRRGAIHRDLKPENILIGRDGTPYVTDFGLARFLDEVPGPGTSGGIAGTRPYLAPEQIDAARFGGLGRATDVYALGAVLYLLLTGRVPFTSVNEAALLRQILDDAPDAPGRLRPGLPRDLETVCLKCLEKDPRRRYATAAELADDLNRFLAGLPVRARPAGPLRRAGLWLRRRPTTAVLIASAALLASGMVAGLAVHTRRLEAINRDLGASNRRLRRTAYVDAVRRTNVLLDQGDVGGALRLLAEWEPTPGEEDLRGWEWYYLRGRVGRGQLAQWDVGEVYALALSPDGRALAGGGPDGRLRVWDPDTGRELAPPRPHPGDVNAVVWAPAGSWLATACDDGVVRLWPRDGGPAAELVGHTGKAKALAVTADGRTLVSVGLDRAVRVWDVPTRSARHVLPQPETLDAVAVDDAASTAIIPVGSRLTVWDLASGRPAAEPVNLEVTAPIGALRLDPTGNRLACASGLGGVMFERAPGGRGWHFRSRLPGIAGHVGGLAFGPGGRLLVSASDSGVTLWVADGARRRGEARGHDGRVHAVAVFPDGRRLATAGADGTVRVWDLEQVADVYELPPGTTYVARGGPYSPFWLAGRPVFVTRADPGCSVVAWDCGPGPPQSRNLGVPATPGPFAPEAVAAGPTLLAADAAGRVFRRGDDGWVDLGFAVTRSSPPPEVELPFRLAADPAGRRLAATAGPDVLVTDAATGRRLATLSGHRRSLYALAFAPDGATLASVGTGGRVCLWDMASGRLLATPTGHAGAVHAAAFSPDGTLLATAGADRVIRFWDRTGREVKRFVGHRATINDLAFAPDGRTLASASDDGTVRLWQTATGGELLTTTAVSGAVFHVSFSPDGRFLATAGSTDPPAVRSFVQIRDCGQALNAAVGPGDGAGR
jgi:WD40 repeat protein